MKKLKREGVIGIILIIALLILTYALVQASVVPFWDKEVEAEHIGIVYNDMISLRSDMEDVAQHGTPKSSIVHLGVQYPNRILFFNPGPGAAGSITVENASITGSYTASGASTHPLNYNSSRIIYELNGMIHSPKLVYEHGIIIWDWGTDRIVTANSQSLINQGTGNVHIPVVAASPGTTSGLETELFEIYPYSITSDRIGVESATITLGTDYPEVWCSLLKDYINAGLVSVCNQTKKIRISSSAFTYITLPYQPAPGAVSSGIITLSQELPPGAVLTIPTVTTQNATAVDENNVTSTPTPEDDGRVVSGGGGTSSSSSSSSSGGGGGGGGGGGSSGSGSSSGGGGVIADKPPAVMTKNATKITALSAILNMTYDFNDYSTVHVQFRYKAEGASAWNETGWVSQFGSGSHWYSEPIAGLSLNTTYYFMALLRYDSTVLNGTELNFTTNRDLTPPAVMTKTATSVTALSAILNMGFDFNDYDTVHVQFRYKAEGASIWNETGWVSQFGSGSHRYSEPIAGLSLNTTYYFMALLRYDSTVLNGTELNFTTSGKLTPPTVMTKTATNVIALSAILNMAFDFNDYDTVQVQFRYKAEGASAWNETHWVSQNGSGLHTYAEPIADLSCVTTYYFIAQLKYGSTVIEGAEQSFTTYEQPTVRTKTATNVSDAAATLNMGFDFKDYSSVHVQFRYKAEGASAWIETGWVSQNGSGFHWYTEPIAGLSSGTTYCFKAQLRYDGTVLEGVERSFTTLESPAVRTENATDITDVSATLNMAYDLRDYTTVQVQFRYKAEGASAWIETGWVSQPSSHGYTEPIAGLSSGTTYCFKAQLRYDGTVLEGVERSFTTLESPAVRTENATDITGVSATLNMAYDLRDYTTVQVQFRYKAEGASGWIETGWISPPGSNRYSESIANLCSSTTYYFMALLRYDGTAIEGVEKSFMTLEPPTVSTKNATKVTHATATLNMAYDLNDYSTVQVQFEYKAEEASAWIETGWVSQNGSQTYSEPIANLSYITTYYFKAQLRYGSTVIEGAEQSFMTLEPPAVHTKTATNVTDAAATLNMAFDFNDYGTVQVQFRYKAEGASAWNETGWVSQSGSGFHWYAEPITGLSSSTVYQFKAQLRYDGMVIEGQERSFITAEKPTVSTKNAVVQRWERGWLATLKMDYDFKDYGFGYVRFAYKKVGDTDWDPTDWVGSSYSGTYEELIRALEDGTTYYFKAQLKYGDNTIIDGVILSFKTLEPR